MRVLDRKNCGRYTVGVLALAIASINSAPIYAATESLTLEEVFVSARKRLETAQDIPEAITTFDNKSIEDAGITRIKDVADLTPNLILRPSFRMGVVNLTARGLSTPQQGDAPIVLNFDGVQAPAQDFINQDLFDIERIEVLKGPQGALYGAGAIGGAINIISKQPTNEFSGFLKANIGSDGYERLVGGLSGPIVEDQLFYRVSAVYTDKDGYIENKYSGEEVDFLEETAFRGSILAELDNLVIDLRASYTDGEAGASYYEAHPVTPDPVAAIDPTGTLGRLGSDISDADYENTSGIGTIEERTVEAVSLKVDYEFEAGVFSSVTGYNNSEQEDYGDLDFQPIDVLHQDVRYDVEVVNQEFRFESSEEEDFRWVTGVFFQEKEVYNQVIVPLGNFQVYDFANGKMQTIEEAKAAVSAIAVDGRDTTESSSKGIFFSSDYDITDNLVLTTAFRYDEIEVETEYVGDDANLKALGTKTTKTFSKSQPKINLSYTVNDEIMVYADAARGFRPGAANPTAGVAGGLARFIDAEVADTYELGFKSRLLEGRMTLNGAIFQSNIENRHHYFFGASLQSMATFDEAEVKGIELDMVLAVAEGIKLQASVGLMDAKIASDEISVYNDANGDPALTVNNKGNVLPDTPEQSYNVALTYDRPIFGDVNLYSRVAYKHVGEIFFDTENEIDNGGSTDMYDFKLGLQSEAWDVMAYVNNVTDERTYTNYAFGVGHGSYLPNQPKTYGVEVNYRF